MKCQFVQLKWMTSCDEEQGLLLLAQNKYLLRKYFPGIKIFMPIKIFATYHPDQWRKRSEWIILHLPQKYRQEFGHCSWCKVANLNTSL